MEDDSIVVIGGSAGALWPIRQIVAGLPSVFPSGVLVVIHYPDDAPSSLARILNRSGPLPASTLAGDERILAGHIGVGPPGRHVVVSGRRTRLETGPRENGQRPSIDVLFRSAARDYGPQATGVLVSGTLDDGTLGLAEIVRCGGRALVQRPSEADFDSMPLSAIRGVPGVEVASASEIGRRLAERARATAEGSRAPAPEPAHRLSTRAIQTRLSCPACGGPLAEMVENEPPAFRCRVGHAFTIGSLARATERAGETALWQAIRTHEERVDILSRLSVGARERRDAQMAETYQRLADEASGLAVRLRSVIEREPAGGWSVRESGDLAEGSLVDDDAVEKIGHVRP